MSSNTAAPSSGAAAAPNAATNNNEKQNPPAATAAAQQQSNQPNDQNEEEQLRRQLRDALRAIKKREPLDITYKRLLMNGIVTNRRPVLMRLTKDQQRAYQQVGSGLRQRIEAWQQQMLGKDPFDRVATRQPIDTDTAMRAAFTLREPKRHEQTALLESALMAMPRRQGMDAMTRKRHLDGIALGLQSSHRHRKKKAPPPSAQTPLSSPSAAHNAAAAAASPSHDNTAQQQHETAEKLERQRQLAKSRENARRKRQEDERQRRQDEVEARKRALVETPRQALHKLYTPIFKKLWEMEFAHLNSTNPFRIVIDRANCATMGAPDYFDIISEPMNLTCIQNKVEAMEYESLAKFFADVDLMLNNALAYNTDPSNPYRIAALEMKKRYHKIVRKVLNAIKQRK